MSEGGAVGQAAPARRRSRSLRCIVERMLLGSIMTVVAVVLDRRLQRVFSKR